MKILFVCTGNTCRSVMAHYLMKKLVQDRGLDWEIDSCGTGANPNFPASEPVSELLKKAGVSSFRHTPRQVTSERAQWADLILGMEKMHCNILKSFFPQTGHKVHLLREYAGLKENLEVPDPIYQPMEVYESTFLSIQEALVKILERHGSKTAPKSGS